MYLIVLSDIKIIFFFLLLTFKVEYYDSTIIWNKFDELKERPALK